MAIAKLLGPDGQIPTLKVRLKNNHSIVEFVKNTSEEVTFLPKAVIGILDLRFLGYFRVNHEDYAIHLIPFLIGYMREVMTSDKILTLPKTHILGWSQMILGDIRLMQRF